MTASATLEYASLIYNPGTLVVTLGIRKALWVLIVTIIVEGETVAILVEVMFAITILVDTVVPDLICCGANARVRIVTIVTVIQ
jgi:hypothetical protein